ncbi:phosphatases II [Xylariaceae sp. FL0594]|nr:phosphatases II [Xylariaceae sp. FL0594]
MASFITSILRQVVASPRARHLEAGLDLCYVTDNIIATSGPSHTYPQRAYRNPLDRLVEFLDSKHGSNWAIWEFRAEGTGYPDELVYHRIRHYPWPDHHPPPFRLVPMIVASMRNWLDGNDIGPGTPHAIEAKSEPKATITQGIGDKDKDKDNGRVVVVHCKAGKGRSGTMACSYLIAECGWTPEQAIARFTERRMRPRFGAGVSIPSQLRWVGYVDRWTRGGKRYIDRELEILEIHVWGLRDGVKLSVEGFVDEGRKIKTFHTFTKQERRIVEGDAPGGSGMLDMVYEMAGYGSGSPATEQQDPAGTGVEHQDSGGTPSQTSRMKKLPKLINPKSLKKASTTDSFHPTSPLTRSNTETEPGGMAVIFKPDQPIRIPNSDVNIAIERRNRAPKSVGLTVVTSVAHVWFNAFFEGNGPEQGGVPDTQGVFEIEWDALDGIKGSSQKGRRAADRIAVVWRSVVPEAGGEEAVIEEPRPDEIVPQMQPADWKGGNDEDPGKEKHLGPRVKSPVSVAGSEAASKASSIVGEAMDAEKKGRDGGDDDDDGEDFEGLRSDTAEDDVDGTHAVQTKAKDPLKAYAEKLPEPKGSDT